MRFGEYLVSEGIVPPVAITMALEFQQQKRAFLRQMLESDPSQLTLGQELDLELSKTSRLGEVLVEMSYLTQQQLDEHLAAYLDESGHGEHLHAAFQASHARMPVSPPSF